MWGRMLGRWFGKLGRSSEEAATSDMGPQDMSRALIGALESISLAIGASGQVDPRMRLRTQGLASAVAESMALEPPDRAAIETAALLRDIGKLSVPPHLLNKPGRLSATELARVCQHPVVAADLLAKVDFPFPVEPLVRYHHERWDGKGYPSGLVGEEIPLGARILAVVDCYEAMTSERPFRHRLPEPDVRRYISEQSGSAFDPEVVHHFLDLVESQPVEHDAPEDSEYPPAVHAIGSAFRETVGLYEIARVLGSSTDLGRGFQSAAGTIRSLVPMSLAVVYRARHNGSDLAAACCWGLGFDELPGHTVSRGVGGSGVVSVSGTPLLNFDPALDGLRHLDGHVLHQGVAVPVRSGDLNLGVLAVYRDELEPFGPDDARVLEHVADCVATGMVAEDTHRRCLENALTDPSTALHTRRFLESFFECERERTRRQGRAMALVTVEIDGLSSDDPSTAEAARALRLLAVLVRRQLRGGDVLAVDVGPSLMALMTDIHSASVRTVAGRIGRSTLASIEELEGMLEGLDLRVGHATFPDDGEDLEALLEHCRGCATRPSQEGLAEVIYFAEHRRG